MKEKILFEAISELKEEVLNMELKKDLSGRVYLHTTRGGKQQKPIEFEDIPKTLKNRILVLLKKENKEIKTEEDLLKFIKKNSLKISLMGDRLRVVDYKGKEKPLGKNSQNRGYLMKYGMT